MIKPAKSHEIHGWQYSSIYQHPEGAAIRYGHDVPANMGKPVPPETMKKGIEKVAHSKARTSSKVVKCIVFPFRAVGTVAGGLLYGTGMGLCAVLGAATWAPAAVFGGIGGAIGAGVGSLHGAAKKDATGEGIKKSAAKGFEYGAVGVGGLPFILSIPTLFVISVLPRLAGAGIATLGIGLLKFGLQDHIDTKNLSKARDFIIADIEPTFEFLGQL